MQNLFGAIYGDSVRELMSLSGIMQKYIDGDASDFQKLYALCSVFSYCDGNREAENIAKKISLLLDREVGVSELADTPASVLWNEYNARYYGAEVCDEKNKDTKLIFNDMFCDEKNNIKQCIFINNLVDEGVAELPNMQDISVYAELVEDHFCRPSAYASELELCKKSRDEKYNKDIIVCQMLFDASYKNKCRKIQLYLYSKCGEGYLCELIKYAKLRQIGLRMFIVLDGTIPPEGVRRLCLMSNDEIFVTPAVCQRFWSVEQEITDYISELSKIYPCGRVKYLE